MNQSLKPPHAPFDGWSDALRREFDQAVGDGRVGKILVSESERVRVWSLRLEPGERIAAHQHVLDYFWTAVTPGRAISHMDDGTTVEAIYAAGDTRHEQYGPGQYKIHDLENTGDTALVFTTVEFLDSANAALPLPESVRLA
jgi:quercetin dioxygenase-like cupin family protein